jgi:hypothetical protein
LNLSSFIRHGLKLLEHTDNSEVVVQYHIVIPQHRSVKYYGVVRIDTPDFVPQPIVDLCPGVGRIAFSGGKQNKVCLICPPLAFTSLAAASISATNTAGIQTPSPGRSSGAFACKDARNTFVTIMQTA